MLPKSYHNRVRLSLWESITTYTYDRNHKYDISMITKINSSYFAKKNFVYILNLCNKKQKCILKKTKNILYIFHEVATLG